MLESPLNLERWIGEHRERLKPPSLDHRTCGRCGRAHPLPGRAGA